MILMHESEMNGDYLERTWERIQRSGTSARVFYGSDGSLADFLALVKASDSTFFTVHEGDEQLGIFWLNCWQGFTAHIHFCAYKSIYGNALRVGRFVHDSLFAAFRGGRQEYVKTLVGVIPITNRLAIKYGSRLGYQMIGIVPNACYVVDSRRHIDAAIMYCNRLTYRGGDDGSISPEA